MFPVLPFGPMTIPTGPVLTLIAATLGLEIAGRFGRRLGLHMDDVWNTGLFAILAGLIVARLWNVIQFWPIYIAEPWLILSVRPSGFALIPGLIAAVITSYGYMLRYALEPARVTAALGMGIVTGLAIIQVSMFLTGTLIGLNSELPWAVRYYDELRHPVTLYYTVGLILVVMCLWFFGRHIPPTRIILLLLLGCSVIYLAFSAFEDQSTTIMGWRVKQFGGLLIALVSSLTLSRTVMNHSETVGGIESQ